MAKRVSDLLRAPAELATVDTRGTPGFKGSKDDAEADLAEVGGRLADLQSKLYANGVGGISRSVLLVLQGMDTSGKGGTIGKVVGAVNPLGVVIASFKKPTEEERARDFLWRIRKRLPPPGHLGVFDRSHYEDVLIVRVHDLVPRAQWEPRYEIINEFERELTAAGTAVIKVFLHISRDEQRERLLARLDDPTKYWKFNPGDIDERAHWDEYQQAYQAVLERTDRDEAPWYVVPADRKWYRNWAVASLLAEHLEALDLDWPPADYDVAEQQARLLAEG